MPLSRRFAAGPIEFALEHLAVARHEKAEAEIDRRDEDIGLGVKALPVGVGQRRIRRAEQIEKTES